jgi:hypothetical protein
MLQVTGYHAARGMDGGAFMERFASAEKFVAWLAIRSAAHPIVITSVEWM